MERLTMTSDKGGVALTFDLDVNCEKSEILKILKLAEKLKEYEDLEEQGKLRKLPCAVGDTVYFRHDGIKIEPMRVKEIEIAEYGISLTLEYFGNDEKLKYWRVKIESTAFGNKILFVDKEEAEAALQKIKKGGGAE